MGAGQGVWPWVGRANSEGMSYGNQRQTQRRLSGISDYQISVFSGVTQCLTTCVPRLAQQRCPGSPLMPPLIFLPGSTPDVNGYRHGADPNHGHMGKRRHQGANGAAGFGVNKPTRWRSVTEVEHLYGTGSYCGRQQLLEWTSIYSNGPKMTETMVPLREGGSRGRGKTRGGSSG